MAVRWTCPDCERDIIPVDGVTVVEGRGYWWCLHCVEWDDIINIVVAFPSNGMLYPSTLFADGDAEGQPGETEEESDAPQA